MRDDCPALRYLTARMNEAVKVAGGPSLRDMERLCDQLKDYRGCLRRATLQEYLKGTRKSPPPEMLLVAFVNVLRIIVAQKGGVADQMIGTVQEWLEIRNQALAELKNDQDAAVEDDAEETGQAAAQELAMALPAFSHPAEVSIRTIGAGDTAADDPYAALCTLARRYQVHEWWRDYADVVPPWLGPYLSLEAAARLIHCYECQFVPGLLQTPRYAEDVIRLRYAQASQAEVDRRVELRMVRQQILQRPIPPTLWCVIDETALRRRYGSRKVMREQIRNLIDVSYDPNIVIQVLPMAKGGCIAASGPVTLLRFAEDDADDVAYLEWLDDASYPRGSREIASFGSVFDRLIIQAEKPRPARLLLGSILNEI